MFTNLRMQFVQPSPGQLGSPYEVNNLKQKLTDTQKQLADVQRQLEEKQKLVIELEAQIKV